MPEIESLSKQVLDYTVELHKLSNDSKVEKMTNAILEQLSAFNAVYKKAETPSFSDAYTAYANAVLPHVHDAAKKPTVSSFLFMQSCDIIISMAHQMIVKEELERMDIVSSSLARKAVNGKAIPKALSNRMQAMKDALQKSLDETNMHSPKDLIEMVLML